MVPYILLLLVSLLDYVRADNITCPEPPANDATYPLHFGSMTDDYYFAARINSDDSDFLDFKLSGKAKGWVAVGFSATRAMSANDVFGCKKDSNGNSVYVVDTWNPSTHYDPNVLDNTQSGICAHHTEYNNGRINCVFSHYIHVVDEGQDYDLNQSLYRIYSALSDRGGPHLEHLHKHSSTPSITVKKSNIIDDINNNGTNGVSHWPRVILLKIHGILMIISWLLLATSGIFFASWMKPVLPNGEWFITHRILMVGSLIVGVLGFILPFIANAQYVIPGFINFSGSTAAHFVIGVLVMILHITNPLVGLFRCKPDSTKRWIFVLIHGHIIGVIALLLAFVNIGIGITLLLLHEGAVLAVYIVIILLYLSYQVELFIATTILAFCYKKGENKKELMHSLLKYVYYCKGILSKDKIALELKDKEGKEGKEDEKLVPSSGDKPRIKVKLRVIVIGWLSFGIQVSVMSIAVIAFIVVIACSRVK